MPVSAAQSLAELLSRKGMLGLPRAPSRVPTGLLALDALLGGGWAAGRITQLAGPRSSGRTALCLASAAAITGRGGVVALLDAEDALDPRQAAAAGVELARVLWIRPSGWQQSLRAAELTLSTGGFSLVVLDLPRRGRAPESAWPRLAHVAERGGAPLVLVGRGEPAGPFAFATVGLEGARVEWRGRAGGPSILDAFRARASLVRSRDRAPSGAPVELVWRACARPFDSGSRASARDERPFDSGSLARAFAQDERD